MKKINLGSFYGFSLFVEVSDEMSDKDWAKMFENYLESRERHAIEKSAQKQFFKELL